MKRRFASESVETGFPPQEGSEGGEDFLSAKGVRSREESDESLD